MNDEELLYGKIEKYLTEYYRESKPYIVKIVLEPDDAYAKFVTTPTVIRCYIDTNLCGEYERHHFSLYFRFQLKRLVKDFFGVEIFEVYQQDIPLNL